MIPQSAIVKFPFEVTAGYIILTLAAVMIQKYNSKFE